MVTPSLQEIEQDVLAALRAEGLCPETPLELDGRLHRCPVEGRPHGRDGAYQIHTDNCPAGWYQNHVGNRPVQTWKYKGAQPTPEEEARFRREMEQARKEREKETREGYAKAVAFIKAASPLFSPASPEHPYLQRKRVGVFGDLAQADGAQLAALGEVKNADARQEIVVSLVGAELGSEAEEKLRATIEGRYYTAQELARIFETTVPAINRIARTCELKTHLRGSNEFGRWQRVREGCVERIWVYSEVGKDFISKFFVRSLKCPW